MSIVIPVLDYRCICSLTPSHVVVNVILWTHLSHINVIVLNMLLASRISLHVEEGERSTDCRGPIRHGPFASRKAIPDQQCVASLTISGKKILGLACVTCLIGCHSFTGAPSLFAGHFWSAHPAQPRLGQLFIADHVALTSNDYTHFKGHLGATTRWAWCHDGFGYDGHQMVQLFIARPTCHFMIPWMRPVHVYQDPHVPLF